MEDSPPRAQSADDRFFQLFKGCRDGILITTSDGTVIDANPAARDLLVYGRDDLAGINIRTLVKAPTDHRAFPNGDVDFERLDQVELTFEQQTGARVVCLVSTADWTYDGEQFTYVFLRDVSRKKSMEEEIERSEALYRAVLNSLSEAIFITNDEGRLTYVSPNAHVVFGYSSDEIMEMRTVTSLLPEDLVNRLQSELSAKAELTNVQCRVEDKVGRTVDLFVSARQVAIGEGTVLYSCREITELKEVERALRESERKFRQLAEQSIMAICLIQDEIFRYVNPRMSEIFGYEVDTLAGEKGPEDLVFHQDWPELKDYLVQLKADQEVPIRHTARGVRKDGETIHLEIYVTSISSGGEPAVLGYLLDVTDRRQLERALLHVQEEERKRIGQELHDSVASQLTGLALIVSSHIQGLDQGEPVTPEVLERIKEMIREAEEQTRKISHGLHPAALTDGSLAEALHELAESLSLQFEGTSVYRGSYDTPSLDVDRATHLYRIAQEAGTNAVRHADATMIEIDCRETDRMLVMTVTDDGCGFNTDQQTEGIGMQSMHYRAELIGADIMVNSTVDKGTTVICQLPV